MNVLYLKHISHTDMENLFNRCIYVHGYSLIHYEDLIAILQREANQRLSQHQRDQIKHYQVEKQNA